MQTSPMKKKSGVSVVIPAFNEQTTIGHVIHDVLSLSKLYDLEIIVVDDGSGDFTSQRAKKAGAHKVIIHKKNTGKGGAFRTGYKAATKEYVIQIDADRQLRASEIPKLIRPLEEGYSMVLGSRYEIMNLLSSDFTTFIKMYGNLFLSLTATLFSFRLVPDVMTGFKSFTRRAIVDISPKVNHFGYEAELVVKAAKKGYSMKVVTVSCRKREAGRSNLKAIRHGALVFKTILLSSFSK